MPATRSQGRSGQTQQGGRWSVILTLLVIYVTMVYGPIAAMLVELFPVRPAGRRRVLRLPAAAVRGGLVYGDRARGAGPLGDRQRLGLRAVDGRVLHRLDLLRQRRPRRHAGVWFLPIYLGPTLAMVLAWMVLRKMIRIARTYRITSIADFIASRYGKSPLLAGW
jgi:hypothetical protein